MEELRGYIDKIKWEKLLERGEKDDLLRIVNNLLISADEDKWEKDGWDQWVTKSSAATWKETIQRQAKALLAEKYGEDIDKRDALSELRRVHKESERGSVYFTEEIIRRLKTIIASSQRLKLKDIGTSDEELQKLVKKARENAEK
jgi:hypothetical protein